MRKSTLLKLAFVFTAMFLFSGAYAQTTVTVINFDGTAAAAPTLHTITAGVESAAIGTVAGNVITVAAGLTDGTTYAVYSGTERSSFIWHTADGDVTIRTHTIAFSRDADYEQSAEYVYQTAGWNFGLYVDPDPIYNPSYAGSGTIDGAARWTWTYLAGIGTGSVASGADVNINYVEFTNPTAGSYDVTVVEKNTAVSCFDNGQSIHVNVVAEPKAVITTADPATVCGSQPLASVTIQFTEAVPVALAGYAFAVTESVDNLSDLGATPTVTNVSSNLNFVDFPMAGKLNTGNGLLGAASPYSYSFNTSALNVMNNKITRYTYTLVKATDANASASNGLISAINQKSQYIALKTPGAYVVTSSYDGKATYVAIVTPMPQTGPVYFIPNDYAY